MATKEILAVALLAKRKEEGLLVRHQLTFLSKFFFASEFDAELATKGLNNSGFQMFLKNLQTTLDKVLHLNGHVTLWGLCCSWSHQDA